MIYYIYKVRREQTSIRFSRSALPHRYLRSISWKSWNGRKPPQAGSQFHTVPQSAHTSFFAAAPISQGRDSYALVVIATQKAKKASPNLFPKKKKTTFLPIPTRRSPCVALPASPHVPPAAHLRPVHHPPSRRLLRPPYKQKKCGPAALRREPAQKSVDFSLKKNTRRHARLSRSCFGRNRRPAFTTALFPFSFFTKEKKKENRSKFSRFEYIARTHFVRPHDVRDWPVAPRPLKFM